MVSGRQNDSGELSDVVQGRQSNKVGKMNDAHNREYPCFLSILDAKSAPRKASAKKSRKSCFVYANETSELCPVPRMRHSNALLDCSRIPLRDTNRFLND